jgi:hypothetical protein
MKHNIELEEHERQRCEVWTRVMGYHRPVSQFNAGKQSEHRERKFYTESAGAAPQAHQQA